jgi:hypothetical protein
MKNLIESVKGGGRANGLWAGGGPLGRLGRRKDRLAIVAVGRDAMNKLIERRRGGGRAKWIWAGVGLLVAAGVAFNLKELIRYIKIARM